MKHEAVSTLPGTVEKIVKPAFPGDTEKVQIAVEGADHLYREIRIENAMKNSDGTAVALKKGTHVEVQVVADVKDTVKKSD
jgi:hypothetical protein